MQGWGACRGRQAGRVDAGAMAQDWVVLARPSRDECGAALPDAGVAASRRQFCLEYAGICVFPTTALGVRYRAEADIALTRLSLLKRPMLDSS